MTNRSTQDAPSNIVHSKMTTVAFPFCFDSVPAFANFYGTPFPSPFFLKAVPDNAMALAEGTLSLAKLHIALGQDSQAENALCEALQVSCFMDFHNLFY